MLRHLPWAVGLCAAFTSIACSSVATEQEEASGDPLIETGAPIEPVDLLQCWTVEDTAAGAAIFTRHKLLCQKPAQTTYPLVQKEAIVEVRTARSRSFSQRMTTDEELTIGLFATDDLPLTIHTRLIFPKTATAGEQFGLKRENKITRLADATKANPLAFKSPFTLWGVAIRSTESNRLLLSGHHVASSGEYRVGWNFNIPETDPQTLNANPFQESTDGKLEVALIAPASGTLKVSLMGRDAEIAGPGSYVWDGTSLTRDTTVPTPPVTPDVVEPPPAPTCGAEGQARCADGTCAPAHRWDSTVCRACGANGQTYCYDAAAGRRYCAANHRLENEECVSCGSDGQTYCYDRNAGARFCDPGHRIVNDTCTTCGTHGKTYCYDSASGSRFCQPSHRIVNDVCTSCGAEGQTYCYDREAGRRFCNEGLRVVNDACTR